MRLDDVLFDILADNSVDSDWFVWAVPGENGLVGDDSEAVLIRGYNKTLYDQGFIFVSDSIQVLAHYRAYLEKHGEHYRHFWLSSFISRVNNSLTAPAIDTARAIQVELDQFELDFWVDPCGAAPPGCSFVQGEALVKIGQGAVSNRVYLADHVWRYLIRRPLGDKAKTKFQLEELDDFIFD